MFKIFINPKPTTNNRVAFSWEVRTPGSSVGGLALAHGWTETFEEAKAEAEKWADALALKTSYDYTPKDSGVRNK